MKLESLAQTFYAIFLFQSKHDFLRRLACCFFDRMQKSICRKLDEVEIDSENGSVKQCNESIQHSAEDV